LPPQGAADEMKTGMEMVHRQLLSVLENGGVKPMEVIGHSFDPNVHEGVMQVPADGEEVGVVVQELQRGYWLHGKVLRPAMVAVTT
jgi:molecular chaperone GrpE